MYIASLIFIQFLWAIHSFIHLFKVVSRLNFYIKKLFLLMLFSYSCSPFSPLLSLAPLTPLPQSILSYRPCPLVLYSCSLACPFPFFPLLSLSPPPLWSLPVCSSMFLILLCSFVCFVDQVPLISEIMWYLSFTA